MNIPIDRDTLNDAMLFTPFWLCDYPPIEKCTQEIWQQIQRDCSFSHKQERALQFLRALLINLTVACTDWHWLAVSRRSNDYSSRAKEGKIWFPYQHVITILDWMEEMGYLFRQAGLYFPDTGTGYRTKYRWTERLGEIMNTPIETIQHDQEQLVKLTRTEKKKRKGKKPLKKSIPLKVPNNTRKRDRENVCQRMNEVIASSEITVPYEKWLKSTHTERERAYENLRDKATALYTTYSAGGKHYYHPCLTDRKSAQLLVNSMGYDVLGRKRIFCYLSSNFCDGNRRLLRGGRYNAHGIGKYHNYQQFCKEDLRKHILINGEAVCEPDYDAMHISLLYARIGEEYNGNPYEIDGLGIECKPLLKKLRLSIFNTDNLNGIPEILSSYRSDLDRKKQPLLKKERDFLRTYDQVITCRQDCVDLVQTFMAAHPKLKAFFGSGVGTELQFEDSEIMTVILKYAIRNRRTWLPLHDGLIVPVSQSAEAKKIMEDTYKSYTGFLCSVSI